MHTPVPEPGALVWIRQRQWRVERARLIGDVVRLDVAGRERRLTFLAPFDRAIVGSRRTKPRRVRRSGMLARCAGLIAERESTRLPLAAMSARVALLPYQIEPCLAVIDGVRRLLLADEVGLGKTIQAGLILAEMKRTRPSMRALVIVPAALRAQWQAELAAKFDITCTVADRCEIDDAARIGRFGDNPWRRSGIWLTSIDYLRQTHVRDAQPFIPWDVVVIDEAHTACGDSARHDVCDDLAKRARHVVLLSATPHSGDDHRFTRLSGLGALPALDGGDELVLFRRTRAMVATHLSRHLHWRRVHVSPAERRLLQALAAFERDILNAAGEKRRGDALLLLSTFRKRALSSMRALSISVDRRLSWIDKSERRYALDWVQPSLRFDDTPTDEAGDDECDGLTRDSGLDTARERMWLRRLRVLTTDAARTETKLERLERMACRSDEPMVVFTEFRHSLEAITRRLSRTRDVTVLHGGMTDVERESSMQRFQDGRATVLVATDVAAQGLNLQHRARWVVVFELPWTPSRLEQRIGRVDRLGQTRRVHATLLVSSHSMESGILTRLAERVVRARDAMGAVFADLATEPVIARALLYGGPPDAPRTAQEPLLTTPRWRRRGTAAARCLAGRRALAEFWRQPHSGGTARYLHSPRPLFDAASTVLWSVPILDALGIVIERHLFGATIETGADVDARTRLPAMEAIAHRRLTARVRRLARIATARLGHRRAVERAIGDHLLRQQYPETTQDGLFDRRNARVREHARTARRDIAEHENGAIAEWSGAARLSAGRAVLEIAAGTWR